MSEELAMVVRETTEIDRPSPREIIGRATDEAKELARVIQDQKLYAVIQGKKFVKCEGWTTLACLRGCLPREVEVRELEDGRYWATVELIRMSDGTVLTRASAECGGPEDGPWAKRPPNARHSMAITRATGKACRIAFSWVMALAGYEVTPAEEMMGTMEPDHKARPAGITVTEEGIPLWRGKILTYEKFTGDKNGKPWTLHKFKAHDGTTFSTFHDSMSDAMQKLIGMMAEVEWEPGPKDSKNITRCSPLT